MSPWSWYKVVLRIQILSQKFFFFCKLLLPSKLLLPTKVQQPLKRALIDESFTHYILLNYMGLIYLLFKEKKYIEIEILSKNMV